MGKNKKSIIVEALETALTAGTGFTGAKLVKEKVIDKALEAKARIAAERAKEKAIKAAEEEWKKYADLWDALNDPHN